MRRRRRALLIVTLSLLTSAATAHAECAWVLWLSSSIGATETTKPMESYKSLQECKRDQYGEKMNAIVSDGKKRGAFLYPVCLPDTVDPRGPKPSGR